jgi:hypothetical protein
VCRQQRQNPKYTHAADATSRGRLRLVVALRISNRSSVPFSS